MSEDKRINEIKELISEITGEEVKSAAIIKGGALDMASVLSHMRADHEFLDNCTERGLNDPVLLADRCDLGSLMRITADVVEERNKMAEDGPVDSKTINNVIKALLFLRVNIYKSLTEYMLECLAAYKREKGEKSS